MNHTEAWNALVKKYLQEFNGQFPISIDNVRSARPITPQHWEWINIRHNDGAQNTLGRKGNRKFLYTGIVTVSVYTPANEGIDVNNNAATAVLNLMDAEILGNLWTFNGRIETVGSDGEYYQQNVVIEYNFEDTR